MSKINEFCRFYFLRKIENAHKYFFNLRFSKNPKMPCHKKTERSDTIILVILVILLF